MRYKTIIALISLLALFDSCAVHTHQYNPPQIKAEDKGHLNLKIENNKFNLIGLDSIIRSSGIEPDSSAKVKAHVEFLNDTLFEVDVRKVRYPYHQGGGGTFMQLSDGNFYRLYTLGKYDFGLLEEYAYFSYTRCKVYLSYNNEVFFKYFFNIPAERHGKFDTLPYPYESELWAFGKDVGNYILSLCLLPAFSNVSLLSKGDVAEKTIYLNWIYWLDKRELIPDIVKCRDSSDDEGIKNICNTLLERFEKKKK
jgi:hypothetical protein